MTPVHCSEQIEPRILSESMRVIGLMILPDKDNPAQGMP